MSSKLLFIQIIIFKRFFKCCKFLKYKISFFYIKDIKIFPNIENKIVKNIKGNMNEEIDLICFYIKSKI